MISSPKFGQKDDLKRQGIFTTHFVRETSEGDKEEGGGMNEEFRISKFSEPFSCSL